MAAPTAAPAQQSSSVEDGGGAAAAGGIARGALVVLEGLDRSGKTTQVKLLEQRFVELGKRVKVMRFPGRWSVSIRCM
jgi:dTMP kinase